VERVERQARTRSLRIDVDTSTSQTTDVLISQPRSTRRAVASRPAGGHKRRAEEQGDVSQTAATAFEDAAGHTTRPRKRSTRQQLALPDTPTQSGSTAATSSTPAHGLPNSEHRPEPPTAPVWTINDKCSVCYERFTNSESTNCIACTRRVHKPCLERWHETAPLPTCIEW